jgi:hypothetical protein
MRTCGRVRRIRETLGNRTYMVQRFCQIFRPAAVRQVSVRRMISEKLLLLPQRLFHRQPSIDILLTPVHDADKPELERVRPPRKNIERIRSGVHEVELCEHADCAETSRIDGPRELERVRVGDILVCGGDGEDDGVGF